LMGDGVIVEFASPVHAVSGAIALQRQFESANEGLPEDGRILLRAGINLGDVAVERGDLFGEGVIVAVRLQSMAEPGTIFISSAVHDHVAGKLPVEFDDLGPCEVKNSSKPVWTFRVRPQNGEAARRAQHRERCCRSPFFRSRTLAAMPARNNSPMA
jgi:class 3 adenylate cyclase